MFWGITLENGKRYTQIVDKAFHISMASLEQSSRNKDSFVSIMFEQDKSEFLLCTLQHGKLFQQPLDLNFMVEDTVTLYLNGEGIVHLTGYIMEPEDDEEYSDDEASEDFLLKALGKKAKNSKGGESDQSDMSEEDDEDDDDEEDDDDSDEDVTPGKGQKRKAINTKVHSAKKVKTEESDSDDDEDDDSEEEDSDDEGDFKSFSKKAKGAASPAQQGKGGNKTPGGPQVIKTPQQQQGKKGNQQQQQQQKSPGGSPGKPKQGGQQNGKGGQQQKTPAKANTPAPKTPALTNGATPSESPELSAKQRKRMRRKERNASQLGSPQTPANQTPNKGATIAPATSEKKKKDKKQKATPGTPAAVATPKPEKIEKLPGGTQASDVVVGSGPVAKPGKHVQVYYSGKIGNKEFDSVVTGKPFKFRLGAGEVIKGWDAGIQGMKVGGKRTLVVPPNQGYGSQGTGPIPPNSTLKFEVQLLSVN